MRQTAGRASSCQGSSSPSVSPAPRQSWWVPKFMHHMLVCKVPGPEAVDLLLLFCPVSPALARPGFLISPARADPALGKRGLTRADPLFWNLPPPASISTMLLAGNKGAALWVTSFSRVAKSQASKNSYSEISSQRERTLAEAYHFLQSYLHIYLLLPSSLQSQEKTCQPLS